MNDSTPSHTNRLIHEKSPYLQQHAHNPVDWYPWGDEAFERARREGRPIFLSIGYSTCHWCHVMERESFEDEETAALMNDLFVNIKVDREERPDIDAVYMAAAQAINGNGGWPLSAWLTPELEPFYVGTYFPPTARYGRPGFRDALHGLHNAWTNEREKVARTSTAIMRAVAEQTQVRGSGDDSADVAVIADRCLAQVTSSYDPRYGGFSGAPKFPRPAIAEFLLRAHVMLGDAKALAMTIDTVRRMAGGGMYDQLGGGFARYSVDAEWRVPHFEKMLYDQGQLIGLMADTLRLRQDAALEGVIDQTIEYLERDLMHPTGLFYSAEDADSEGVEGKFYAWTLRELGSLLSEQQYAAVVHYYGLTPEGNFEHGNNVLHVSATVDAVAARLSVTPAEAEDLLAQARETLFTHRTRRVRPHRDEKILASWNGLAISGLARASMALGDSGAGERAVLLACRAADALLERMVIGGALMHRLKDDEVRYDGYLDDYAFVAAGLLDLHEATFDIRYLRAADELTRRALKLFEDVADGGFFMTAGNDPSVLVRAKSDHDGAEPSGNSTMAFNLVRLGGLFHDETLLVAARRTIGLFLSRIVEHPIMMPLMVAAAMIAAEPPRQIVIAASDDEVDTARLVRQARAHYRPGAALVFVPRTGVDVWLAARVEGLDGMGPVDGRAAAYVCEGFVCHAPVLELAAEPIREH